MKASDLREMTSAELQRKLADTRDELFKLRMRRGSEELPNPIRLRFLRRDIARCLTMIGAAEKAAVKK